VTDEQDERTARTRVLELDVDLARRGFESHLEPNRGDAREDEELRQVPERGRHARARAEGMKTWAVDRSSPTPGWG